MQVEQVEKYLVHKAARLKKQGRSAEVIRRSNHRDHSTEFFLAIDRRPGQINPAFAAVDMSRQVHIVISEGDSNIAFISHTVPGGGYSGPNWSHWSEFCETNSARRSIGRHIAHAAHGLHRVFELQNNPHGFKVERLF